MLQLGKDPEKIKQLLVKYKDFQRTLGAKQPIYHAVTRLGKIVKNTDPKTDKTILRHESQMAVSRSVSFILTSLINF